jgi:hypothetical protein
LIFSFATNAQAVVLKFKDGTSLDVQASELGKELIPKPSSGGSKTVISTQHQSFEGVFLSLGKPIPPLSLRSIQNLKLKHRDLAHKVSKINTAYEFTQNEQKFYFSGLGNIAALHGKAAQCFETKACIADFDVVLIEFKSDQSVHTIAILKSVKLR